MTYLKDTSINLLANGYFEGARDFSFGTKNQNGIKTITAAVACGRSYTRHNYIDGFEGTSAFILFKITEAVKFIFGASLWQKTTSQLANEMAKDHEIKDASNTLLTETETLEKFKSLANEYLNVIKDTYSKDQEDVDTKDQAEKFIADALTIAHNNFLDNNKIEIEEKESELSL